MMIHIPAPTPSRIPLKGNNTLCGKIIGTTQGIISLDNFINPIRMHNAKRLYEVFFTKKGYEWARNKDPDFGLYKDRGYWQGYLKGYEFRLCSHCQESDEFGMMVLAEL